MNDGCDPNTKDVNGETLLIHVIKSNKTKSFKYLISHDVDINQANEDG